MKNKIILNTLLVSFVFTFGCSTDRHALDFSPNPGVNASNQSYFGATLVTAVPGNQTLVSSQDGELGTRIGKADQYTILGLISYGEGMADATKRAGIQQVTSVERNTSFQFFPFFKKSTITVTGNSRVKPSSQYAPAFLNRSPSNSSPKEFFPNR